MKTSRYAEAQIIHCPAGDCKAICREGRSCVRPKAVCRWPSCAASMALCRCPAQNVKISASFCISSLNSGAKWVQLHFYGEMVGRRLPSSPSKRPQRGLIGLFRRGQPYRSDGFMELRYGTGVVKTTQHEDPA